MWSKPSASSEVPQGAGHAVPSAVSNGAGLAEGWGAMGRKKPRELAGLGLRLVLAVTITGGGWPVVHPGARPSHRPAPHRHS